jgi:hypothetical protein
MQSLKYIVSRNRTDFERVGMTGERLHRELLFVVRHHMVIRAACKAFDCGIPYHEGPVWFGDESWMTDHWKNSWCAQKAYREGEEARARFDSFEDNPYRKRNVSKSLASLILEMSWKQGFEGEPQ